VARIKEKLMFNKSRRSAIAAVVSFLLTLSTLLFTTPIAAHTPPAPQHVDFSLRSIDGQTISSDDVRGQVVVLAIGASWLPLTRKQLQGVRKLADEYGKRGVVVYWVSADSGTPKSKNYASDETLRAFSRRNELNVTVLRDPDGKVIKQFGVDQLPAIVILDKQGNISGAPINGLDPEGNLAEQLAPRLDKLLL
jgi:peroxiredoxin